MKNKRFLSSKIIMVGTILALLSCRLVTGSPEATDEPESEDASPLANTATSTFAPPTATPLPTQTPTPIGPPSYSEVVAAYPEGTDLCISDYSVVEVLPDGQWSLQGTLEFSSGGTLLECFGVKVTLEVPVTLYGTTFPPGTKLTLDKDFNWIEVSDFD
ncbi:MAG: hypothetical protein FVQ83_06970 [Chloroflexi bacterium]|nr:hypothetical protein [Chloroflexota bacterium]